MDLLGAIKDTPLPTVFVVAGIVFWLLAIAGSVAGKITVRPEHQQTAGILGTVLLISGLVLSYLPAPQSRPHDATVPAPAPTVPAPAPTVPTPDKPAQPGSDWVSKFDGNWLVRRVARASAGCVGRRPPVLNFQIHLESGKVSGRFEPKEISDLPGSRPPIIGSYPPTAKSISTTTLWTIQAKLTTPTPRITPGHFAEILLQAHIALVIVAAHSRWKERQHQRCHNRAGNLGRSSDLPVCPGW